VNAGQSARQVAIVTGAGGGIGRAIVTRLAGDGFAVVAGDIDPSSLGDLADDPALSGPRSSARRPRTAGTARLSTWHR